MAAKKGGGLKQNLVWIMMIGALGLLAYFTLLKDSNKSPTTQVGTKGEVAAVSTPKSASGTGAGGSSESASAKNLGASFNLSPKNGGSLGGSYLLKNISMSKGSAYESANIFLKSISGTSNFPKYGASISNSTITIILSDTKNFDLDAGGPSYAGENPLIVNGSIIKNISWAQNGENSLRININLKKQASFDDVVLNNPPTLEIRVAI